MAPRRRCPVCGSRQWHKEPTSGLVICREGHVLQNYRSEVTEGREFGPHTMHKRTLKSGRKKREQTSKADPKLYHGARAQYHYFQCLQLLLRKQVAVLMRLWDLPPEFEVVCRDVWTLHLSLLPAPPPPEPWLHEQDIEGKHSHSQPVTDQKPSDEISGKNKSEGDSPSDNDSDSSSSSPEDEEETIQGPLDGELAELLRAMSESSGSSDDEHADGTKPRPEPNSRPRRSKFQGASSNADGPASTIAVLVIACWTLRLPIMYMDLIRLIEMYDLPYLDTLGHLPSEMTRHLTKHTMRRLSPPHAPTPLLLQALSARLAKRMRASYRIQTPELNAAPLLWRVVRALGGTPVLYGLTKAIAHVANLPLTLHHSLAPSLLRMQQHDPESHKYDNVPPEVAFAASVIIVLKMVYGLDGKARVTRDPGDPACALPRMDECLALIKRLDDEDAKSEASVFGARTNMHTAELSESMLDGYLDFCEKALIGPRKQAQGSEGTVIESYFALEGPKRGREAEATDGDSRGTRAEGALQAAVPAEGGLGVGEPGSGYAIYSAGDVLGSVPEEYEAVVGRAARWTGVSGEYIYGVTEKYERRVVRWWAGMRRDECRRVDATAMTKGS